MLEIKVVVVLLSVEYNLALALSVSLVFNAIGVSSFLKLKTYSSVSLKRIVNVKRAKCLAYIYIPTFVVYIVV